MSSGGSGLDTAEADLEHWVAESVSKALMRQQGMQLKQCQDAPTRVQSEDLSQVPPNRFPGLLQEDETAIIHEPSKFWGQEEILGQDGQEDGNLGEKEDQEKGRGGGSEVGEAAGSLDLGWDKMSGDHGSPGETAAQDEEESLGSGRAEVLEPRQGEQEGGIHVVGESRTGEGNNTPGSLGETQNVQENREATAGLEVQVEAVKLDMGDGNGQGRSRSEDEEEGGTSKNYGEPDRAGGSGDEQGGPEGDTESQEGSRSPEEDVASINTGPEQFPVEPRICSTSEQDDGSSCQTSSLQNGQPLGVKLMEEGTESICEGEEEEEEVEESEADTDIEAALAPFSKKPKSRDQQSEADLQRLPDLWADAEEESKDDSLHDKDDFYD
ncbi:uncharacterized protein LOC128404074 [Podarcis raffonei]|uniref:uncharacterized protein LOC128404074 n=1 Tax=Podarcis raffonei TaxID=65483 RepID=UPI0023293F6D|nr:uncharacterized protein LOC128404074 [Podarcis raffonei]